jgi:hypothetical protein
MDVAAIDRELRGLQSELASLQGRFDTERFLGANLQDFVNVMNYVVQQRNWSVTHESKTGGIFGFGATRNYKLKDYTSALDHPCYIRINSKNAEIYVDWSRSWDVFETPTEFQEALERILVHW